METAIDTQTQAKIDNLKLWDRDRVASLQDKAINIKGKHYVLVSDRILYFNEKFPEGSITTELLSNPDADMVVVKATASPDGKRFYTGHSQAKWGDGYINKTSAVENAETSAVGRALGFMGIGVIESIASVDEMVKANGRAKGDQTAADIEAGFLDPEHHLPHRKLKAIIDACESNGHSQLAQAKFLGEHGYGNWEQVLNKDWELAWNWAFKPSTVPSDLTEATQASVGMVSAARVLASGVNGLCAVCNSKLSPSKQAGKPPYCVPCWKKTKGL